MPRRLKTLSIDEVKEVLASIQGGQDKRAIASKLDISPATVKTIGKKFDGKPANEIEDEVAGWDKYRKIFRAVFFEQFNAVNGQHIELPFTTGDLARWKSELKLEGGNPYDLKYNVKGRGALPSDVQATAPEGKEWRIRATGKGKYVFDLYQQGEGVFEIDAAAIAVKIPDALPSIVERYARDDEQALLARIRYNNLVSVFLGLSTYSLQSHWKTAAAGTGSPVEIDELYIGLDRNGAHYAIPVEAKGRAKTERLTAEQILANFDAAADSFPNTTVIPLAAKVVDEYTFAMIQFEVDHENETVTKVAERHYTLASNPPVPGLNRPVLADDDVKANGRLNLDLAQEANDADEGDTPTDETT